MAFCASLRHRSSCDTLVKVITGSTIAQPIPLQLRENSLNTHDVALPIAKSATNNRAFRAIIVSSNAIKRERVQTTTARLDRFQALTAGSDCAIFFLQLDNSPSASSGFLQSQYASFQDLQVLLFKQSISIPLMFLPTAESLFDALKVYVSAAAEHLPALPNASMDILPYVSFQQPLNKKVHMALSDATSNMRDMAAFAESEHAKSILMQLDLSVNEIDEFQGFWMDQFVVDA